MNWKQQTAWLQLKKALFLFDQTHQAIVLLAYHLQIWCQAHRYCFQCGEVLVDSLVERARCCLTCDIVDYPRISPCVIVLIRRDERLLLVRGHDFPVGIYGAVAGFVEPGESCEMAVRREVLEETGLSLTDLQYVDSQAWPFPDRLMLGYVANYYAGELNIDTSEIADARWFYSDELPDMPASMSIAQQLINYQKYQLQR